MHDAGLGWSYTNNNRNHMWTYWQRLARQDRARLLQFSDNIWFWFKILKLNFMSWNVIWSSKAFPAFSQFKSFVWWVAFLVSMEAFDSSIRRLADYFTLIHFAIRSICPRPPLPQTCAKCSVAISHSCSQRSLLSLCLIEPISVFLWAVDLHWICKLTALDKISTIVGLSGRCVGMGESVPDTSTAKGVAALQ